MIAWNDQHEYMGFLEFLCLRDHPIYWHATTVLPKAWKPYPEGEIELLECVDVWNYFHPDELH